MNKVLIHPTFFPSIATFKLILSSPCVLEVSDNFQKQTFRNRTYIYGPSGKQIIVVPVLHANKENNHQLFKDVKIDYRDQWLKVTWKTLETAYRTSPYFEFYEDKIHACLFKKHTFLLDLNISTIETILNCLKVDVSFEKTTSYSQEHPEYQDYRSLTLCKNAIPYSVPEYYQIFSDKTGFIPTLSVLDVLFHEGKHATEIINKVSLN